MGRDWTGNSRAPWQDYCSRQIYHITLLKRADVPSFGSLAGDWRIAPGSPGSSYIKASPLGKAIKDCLREIAAIHPALRVLQYALMPDHLHILLSVESRLDEILGRKLAFFKVTVNNRTGLPRVFDKGFNDQILTATRDLNTCAKIRAVLPSASRIPDSSSVAPTSASATSTVRPTAISSFLTIPSRMPWWYTVPTQQRSGKKTGRSGSTQLPTAACLYRPSSPRMKKPSAARPKASAAG